jgi:hypothetical protein
MGQTRPSLASTIFTHVLDNISQEHPNATRRVVQFASSLLSRGHQSTDYDTTSLWSGNRPSIYSRKSLDPTGPSISHARDIIERLVDKYKPSNRLTTGTCTSFCPSETQYSPRIEANPTQTTACNGTETGLATTSGKSSLSAPPPSYEHLYPTRDPSCPHGAQSSINPTSMSLQPVPAQQNRNTRET